MKFAVILLTILLCSCSSSTKRANKLRPFTTDGCSLYPDGVILVAANRWVHCCIVHDLSYWVGGDQDARNRADLELGECVAQSTSSFHGNLMCAGTHIGGVANNIFPWAWGYGWKYNRGYKRLSSKEKDQTIDKFDTILAALLPWKADLNVIQKSYIIGRTAALRTELKDIDVENSIDDFDKGALAIQEFLK